MSHNVARDQRRDGRGTVEARRRRRMRPTLLALEDRRLLSTIVVNNPTDTPVTGETDLRQAIGLANTTGGAETIVFDKTVFKTPQTITLNGTQLELSDTTGTETITGPKAGVTVSGGGLSRVFQVDPGVTASISGLTITGGGGNTYYGGGLYNEGATTLTNCTVSGNSAFFGGGGLMDGGNVHFGGNPAGTLTLTNCNITGNSASIHTSTQSGGAGGGLFTTPPARPR